MFVVNKEEKREGKKREWSSDGENLGGDEGARKWGEWLKGDRAAKWPAAKIYHYPKQNALWPAGHAPFWLSGLILP